jgi:hypothetical protein
MRPNGPTFELIRRLGRGGMGEVHLARMDNGGLQQLVALKRLRTDVGDEASLSTQFEREGRICSLLRHPHIVSQLAWGTDERGPFLAMEYVEGCTALALLTQMAKHDQHLDLGIALWILRDVTDALAYAHAFPADDGSVVSVVHRDISLDNVLVSAQGMAKLSDFGVARIVGGTRNTRTGTIKGKCAYMAPELFYGAEADVLTDVYAFGVLAYRLLTGVSPIVGRSDAELMRLALEVRPAPLRGVRPGVPSPVADLVDRALAKPRDQRPTSSAELLRVLEDAVAIAGSSRGAVAKQLAEVSARESEPPDERPATVSVAQAPPPARAAPRRAQWALALSAAAVVAVVALAAGAWRASATRLEPNPAAPAEPPAETTPAPAPPLALEVPVPAPSPPLGAPPTRVPAARAPAQQAPTARGQQGTLMIKAKPWAAVFVDGESLGNTPLKPLSLAEGLHSVVLVNDELDVRRSYQVRVRARKQVVVKAVLTEP